jgi:hypothetical protein
MKFLGFQVQRVGHSVLRTATAPRGHTKSQDLDNRLQRLEATADQLQPPHNHDEYLDKSRSKIALKFVRWYLFYVLLIIIGVPAYNHYAVHSNETIDLFKILAQVGTLLGTPLGFVVGYYFKEDNKK